MLTGKKTYITAALTIIGALAAYFTADASVADTAQLIVTALLAAFVRNGVAK